MRESLRVLLASMLIGGCPAGQILPGESLGPTSQSGDQAGAGDSDQVGDDSLPEDGDSASGDAVHGDVSSGDALHGDVSSGDALHGDASSGDALHGDASSGDSGPGDTLEGDGDGGGDPFLCQLEQVGDWLIDEPVTLENCLVRIAGNVTVGAGGSLTSRHSRLDFDSPTRTGYELLVESGAELDVESSVLTGPVDRFFGIRVLEGAQLRMVDSTVENAGWKDQTEEGPDSDKYLDWHWVGARFTRDTSLAGHGLEIHVPVTQQSFTGNTFRNVASIRFHASGNVVAYNEVVGARHEGFAFFGNDNEIHHNVVRDAPLLHRETYGLRFYPGLANNEIHHNEISRVNTGMRVAQIPDWTRGDNFHFHDNQTEQVYVGLSAALTSSIIENETYRSVAHIGMIVGGNSENVAMRQCVIEDVTFVIPELFSYSYYQETKDQVHHRHPQVYYDFLTRRGGISLAWQVTDIRIEGNEIRRVPFHGFGISTDLAYYSNNITIDQNILENIGDANYLELPGIPVNPQIGSVHIPGVPSPDPSCGAIELETTDNLVISGNHFSSVANGIVTDFPDAFGHSGSVEILENELTGLGTLEVENWGWPSSDTDREWIYVQRTPSSEQSRAILLSVVLYGSPGEGPRRDYLVSDANFTITGNVISNWYWPLMIAPETRAAEPDKNVVVSITGNQISQLTEFYLPGYDLDLLYQENQIEE